MLNLLDLAPADAEKTLREFAVGHGHAAYRGSQVVPHLWVKPVASFADMTDLPVAFRELLAAHFQMPRLALEAEQQSTDGTRKFLFRMHDGQAIETVAIPDGERMTFCISSQAG
jgi:23S rRNA (adenine2503-C2)-methyltransferase